MKKLLCLLSFVAFGFFTQAQDKMLSVEDAVMKARTVLAPERLSQLQWIPGTQNLSYVAKKNGKEIIVVQKKNQ